MAVCLGVKVGTIAASHRLGVDIGECHQRVSHDPPVDTWFDPLPDVQTRSMVGGGRGVGAFQVGYRTSASWVCARCLSIHDPLN
jgi:hypothetical protein